MRDDYAVTPGMIATGADCPGEEVGVVVSVDWQGEKYIGCRIAVETSHGDRILKYFPYGKAIRHDDARNGVVQTGFGAELPAVNGAAVKSMQERFREHIACPACK